MSTGSAWNAKREWVGSALDALSANVVILDADGDVAATSGTWAAAGTDGVHELPATGGIDYLEATDGVDRAQAARATAGLAALLDGEREQFELEYPHRSGDDRRWVLLRATPFTRQGERCVAVTHTDVTDRKLRETALRDAYEISTANGLSLLEQVEDLLSVAVDALGARTAAFTRVEDDRYVVEAVASPANSGMEAGDAGPLEEIHPCARVVESRETLVARDVEADASTLAAPEAGTACYLGAPVTVDGETYGTLCCYSDEARSEPFSRWEETFVDLLSKWVSYELEHRDREEQLRHLQENVTDVVWMSTPGKDEIEFVSDSYEDVWGRPRDSLRRDPTSFVDGIHPDDRERVQRALEAQQARPDEYEETYRVVRPDGDVRWIHDHSAGVYDDGELTRIVGVATDITDRKERERELAYQTALLEAQAETTIDGLLVVDADRSVRYHNSQFLDVWGISEEDAADRSDEALLELVSDRLANPEEFRERVEYLYDHPHEQSRDTVELTDDRWVDRYSAPVIGKDGTHYGRLWAFRDITDRKERERALERQRDELVQLQRVNRLVRRSTQALQDATVRDEVETAVCEALTESDLYQTAWVADWTETAAGDQTIRPQTVVGVDESYLEGVPSEQRSPAETALQTGEVQVVNDIPTAPSFPDDRRDAALDKGHHSLAAVPLQKENTTYGVLVVYAPRDHTFTETERDVLADLGKSIALAIQRVHSQRSLTAETVVSLALRVPDAEFAFARVSAELDCELSFERRVAASDGATIYYHVAHGEETGAACERLREDPLVEACTVVREGDDAQPALLETRLGADAQLPLDVLTDYGGTVTSARAVDGDVTLGVELPSNVDVRTVLTAVRDVAPRVELPSNVDVRTVLTAVRDVAPRVELVGKQNDERPTDTAAAVQDRITDQLTDKQAAALQTAYARGYYAWPRDSTMEEIAETFDVSAPTLHYRLRKAHQAVVSALLDPPQSAGGHRN